MRDKLEELGSCFSSSSSYKRRRSDDYARTQSTCRRPRHKQHLYLALDDWDGGYSIHKLDADDILDQEPAAAAVVGEHKLPEPAAVRIALPACDHMSFAAMGTNIFVDTNARCRGDHTPPIFVYNTRTSAITSGPRVPASIHDLRDSMAAGEKRLIRETYLLLVALHQKGFCFQGGFGVDNFIVLQTRQRITVKFANVANETLENIEPNGKKLDLESFTRIIRRNVFEKQLPPHDIELWLSLIGNEEIEGLMPDHALLMDTETCGGSFMAWYDDFVDLKEKRSKKFEDICSNLESYNGWRKRFDHKEGNCLLSETLNIGSYGDIVDELLCLLRNSQQHSSRYRHALFALIVGQDFPNLIADFQKEMYKAGCLEPSPRF